MFPASDFADFLLEKLQATGLAFSEMDWALFERGTRSWGQLKRTSTLSEESRADLFFSAASNLTFVPMELNRGAVYNSSRVQARFQDWLGDGYWLCLESTLEELLTEFYAQRVWTFVVPEPALPGTVDTQS